jgi:hypothetical protein
MATLHVVDAVAIGAANDKSGRRQRLLAMHAGGKPCIEVHSIGSDSAAADFLFDHLRASEASATRDLGEDESIAFCAVEETGATFVSVDKQAAYLALCELGSPRVASPFDLWSWLKDTGRVDAATFSKLCSATAVGDCGIPGVPRRFR